MKKLLILIIMSAGLIQSCLSISMRNAIYKHLLDDRLMMLTSVAAGVYTTIHIDADSAVRKEKWLYGRRNSSDFLVSRDRNEIFQEQLIFRFLVGISTTLFAFGLGDAIKYDHTFSMKNIILTSILSGLIATTAHNSEAENSDERRIKFKRQQQDFKIAAGSTFATLCLAKLGFKGFQKGRSLFQRFRS